MDVEKIAAEVELFWRTDYVQGFLDMDPEAYAGAFGFPCMIRAEDLPRTVFATRAELLPYCAEMIRRAQETTWATSTIDTLSVRVLEEAVAVVDVRASRFDREGRKISDLYAVYTVNKDAGRWRMAAIFGGFTNP